MCFVREITQSKSLQPARGVRCGRVHEGGEGQLEVGAVVLQRAIAAVARQIALREIMNVSLPARNNKCTSVFSPLPTTPCTFTACSEMPCVLSRSLPAVN